MKPTTLALRIAKARGRAMGCYASRFREGLPYGSSFELSLLPPAARRAFMLGYIEVVLDGRTV